MVKLKSCELAVCKGMCCYDGVYLNDDDLSRIDEAVSLHPALFSSISEEKIIEGNWHDKVSGKKTNTKEWLDNPSDYPAQFTNTRCVFMMDDYRCSLQVASLLETAGEDGWKFKPRACWMFPLESNDKGDLLAPVKEKEKDRCKIGEGYPGFATYTACGAHNESGEDYKEVLKKEIDYFEKKTE